MPLRRTKIELSTDALVTVMTAAKEIGVHFATLYRWIDAGDVITARVGGILFIPIDEVERLKNKKAAEA